MDGTENKEALSYINLVPNACRPSFPVRSLPSFSPSFLPLFPPPFFLLFVKKIPPKPDLLVGEFLEASTSRWQCSLILVLWEPDREGGDGKGND